MDDMNMPTGSMDWWHPYFFSNPYGIQLLFESWTVKSTFQVIIMYIFSATMAIIVQILAYRVEQMKLARRVTDNNTTAFSELKYIIVWGGHYSVQAIVMLLLMTFNIGIFFMVILGATTTHYYLQRKSRVHLHEVVNSQECH